VVDLDPTEKALIGTGLIKAVDYLHSRQICNIALKPSNVIVCKNFTPKIFDLTSMKYRDLNLTNKFPETTVYSAPELIDEPDVAMGDDPKALDKAIDVYSLCSVLCELALGRSPWSASLPTPRLCKLIARGEREPIPIGVMPAAVAAAVTAGLAVNPSKRASLQDLIWACEEVKWNIFTGSDALKVSQMVEVLPVGPGVSHSELGLKVGHLQQLVGETDVPVLREQVVTLQAQVTSLLRQVAELKATVERGPKLFVPDYTKKVARSWATEYTADEDGFVYAEGCSHGGKTLLTVDGFTHRLSWGPTGNTWICTSSLIPLRAGAKYQALRGSQPSACDELLFFVPLMV
jgi:hypothetical protein